MHDLILKNVAKHIHFTGEGTDHFTSMISFTEVQKKTLLLAEGQACKNLCYAHAGVLRACHIDTAGKESAIMFAVGDCGAWVRAVF